MRAINSPIQAAEKSNRATVGALCERPFFSESTRCGRSAKRKRGSAQPQENRPPLQRICRFEWVFQQPPRHIALLPFHPFKREVVDARIRILLEVFDRHEEDSPEMNRRESTQLA